MSCNNYVLNQIWLYPVLLLPNGSYTPIKNTWLSRSWLDHCFSSPVLHTSIRNIYIDINSVSSHFHPHVVLKLDTLSYFDAHRDNGNNDNKMNWNFVKQRCAAYFTRLWQNAYPPWPCPPVCSVLRRAAASATVAKRRTRGIHLPPPAAKKALAYLALRDPKVNWFLGGIPMSGTCTPSHGQHSAGGKRVDRLGLARWLLTRGKRGRIFKFALRQCKTDESRRRAEALSAKRQRGHVVDFWKKIRSLSPQTSGRPERIDDAVGERDIS